MSYLFSVKTPYRQAVSALRREIPADKGTRTLLCCIIWHEHQEWKCPGKRQQRWSNRQLCSRSLDNNLLNIHCSVTSALYLMDESGTPRASCASLSPEFAQTLISIGSMTLPNYLILCRPHSPPALNISQYLDMSLKQNKQSKKISWTIL